MSKREVATYKDDHQHDLEGQFIMRLPEEPAKQLREVLQNGLPLKDRLGIRLENDLRYGEVRFDNWTFHAKVVDLPTIVESLKTIDNKSFYKTADICQLLICKEEDDVSNTEDETSIKQKKKDPLKVDKKFLWPHGITPPTKNVRKRRFRKILKKKYVEAPEIEKEVKRILKNDLEAVDVKWEVLCEDEDQTKPNLVSSSELVEPKIENVNDASQSVDVAEHDIFGGAVSDSDEEDEAPINVIDIDETSHLSADSRTADSNSIHPAHMEQSTNEPTTSKGPLVIEFTKEMFTTEESINDVKMEIEEEIIPKVEPKYDSYEASESYSESQNASMNPDMIQERREQLQSELAKLQKQRQQQEETLSTIENQRLRERFREIIDNLLMQEAQKIQELQELEMVN
ncbi:hypothetical protein TKK_0011899 [Trichogramma kaykai]|uniref:TAFII55 protein conserved region domain-containing protein n=1 Tax=Trichogramma kaykai TaxID=54128 RepID=A0ABD2WQB9_9HYME